MSKVTNLDQYIGNQIKSMRVKRGVTQLELAKTLDITTQQIQKYESGKNRVSAANLFRIACHLGVSIYRFVANYSDTSNPTWQEIHRALEMLDRLD